MAQDSETIAPETKPGGGPMKLRFRWPDRLRISRPDGIVIGGGAIMLRRLHFFSGDVSEMPRMRKGSSSPALELPPNIRLIPLTRETWRANPRILETDPAVVAARFAAGGRCLIGWDDARDCLVYHLWVTEAPTYIDWIFRTIVVPPDHLLVFDVWVHPDYRGGNVHWAGAAWACGEAERCGRRYIFAGVEEHEYYPFAMKYARIGLGIIGPHSRIVGLKLFGAAFHFIKGPSPRLAHFRDRLRRMYAKPQAT